MAAMRGQGSPDTLPGPRGGSGPLRVLLATEGFPAAPGTGAGLGDLTETLVRQLPDIEFVVWSLASGASGPSGPSAGRQGELPPNVSRVVEVAPLLALKRLPQAPKGVAGIFNYRGRPVPAVDLCEMATGQPASERLSTRIIIVNYQHENGTEHLLGLIAENATEMLRKNTKDFVDSGVTMESAPYLGPVLMDAQGNLLETEEEIRVSELPGAVNEYINKMHKGVKIKEASKISDAQGMIKYEADIGKEDLIFDNNGNFLKSEKDHHDKDDEKK